MARATWVLACLVASVDLTGCATMKRGPTQVVQIDSFPAGARAHVQPDGQTAVTPALVRLERKSPQMVTLEHDGYQPVSVALTSRRRASRG